MSFNWNTPPIIPSSGGGGGGSLPQDPTFNTVTTNDLTVNNLAHIDLLNVDDHIASDSISTKNLTVNETLTTKDFKVNNLNVDELAVNDDLSVNKLTAETLNINGVEVDNQDNRLHTSSLLVNNIRSSNYLPYNGEGTGAISFGTNTGGQTADVYIYRPLSVGSAAYRKNLTVHGNITSTGNITGGSITGDLNGNVTALTINVDKLLPKDGNNSNMFIGEPGVNPGALNIYRTVQVGNSAYNSNVKVYGDITAENINANNIKGNIDGTITTDDVSVNNLKVKNILPADGEYSIHMGTRGAAGGVYVDIPLYVGADSVKNNLSVNGNITCNDYLYTDSILSTTGSTITISNASGSVKIGTNSSGSEGGVYIYKSTDIGSSSYSKNLTVYGDVNIGGVGNNYPNLTYASSTKALHLTNNLEVEGGISTGGDATITGAVTIGTSSVNKTLRVNGGVIATNTSYAPVLGVNRIMPYDGSAAGTISIGTDASNNTGTLYCYRPLTVGSPNYSKNVTIYGNLTVNGSINGGGISPALLTSNPWSNYITSNNEPPKVVGYTNGSVNNRLITSSGRYYMTTGGSTYTTITGYTSSNWASGIVVADYIIRTNGTCYVSAVTPAAGSGYTVGLFFINPSEALYRRIQDKASTASSPKGWGFRCCSYNDFVYFIYPNGDLQRYGRTDTASSTPLELASLSNYKFDSNKCVAGMTVYIGNTFNTVIVLTSDKRIWSIDDYNPATVQTSTLDVLDGEPVCIKMLTTCNKGIIGTYKSTDKTGGLYLFTYNGITDTVIDIIGKVNMNVLNWVNVFNGYMFIVSGQAKEGETYPTGRSTEPYIYMSTNGFNWFKVEPPFSNDVSTGIYTSHKNIWLPACGFDYSTMGYNGYKEGASLYLQLLLSNMTRYCRWSISNSDPLTESSLIKIHSYDSVGLVNLDVYQ